MNLELYLPLHPNRRTFFHGETFRNTWSPTEYSISFLLRTTYDFCQSKDTLRRSQINLTTFQSQKLARDPKFNIYLTQSNIESFDIYGHKKPRKLSSKYQTRSYYYTQTQSVTENPPNYPEIKLHNSATYPPKSK